jgi:hypothetical protein
VGCSADLGKDAEDTGITDELVRESGVSVSVGVGVRKSFQRCEGVFGRSALVRLLVGLCGWRCWPVAFHVWPGHGAERGGPRELQASPEQGLCAPPIHWNSSEGALLWERRHGAPEGHGCRPAGVADLQLRAVGVGASGCEGFKGEGKREKRWWRGGEIRLRAECRNNGARVSGFDGGGEGSEADASEGRGCGTGGL